MTTVVVQDIKTLRYCNRGARQFFERHDLDWAAFVANGIDADTLLATGDMMAEKVVAVAVERENGRE